MMTSPHFAAASLPEIATVLAAALAPLAILLGGFYKFAKDQMRDSREERREERQVFSQALDQLGKKIAEDVEVGRQLVEETRKGNHEAAQRNGHLGEQNVQITDIVTKGFEQLLQVADRNLEAYSNIDKQVVTKQVVKKEVVKQQEVQGETSA